MTDLTERYTEDTDCPAGWKDITAGLTSGVFADKDALPVPGSMIEVRWKPSWKSTLRSVGRYRVTAKRRKQIEQYLRNEVQTYDHYLTNNVYGFTVEQWDGAGWDNEDSCWGFFGDDVNESGMMCYLDRDFTLEQVREAHRYDKRGEWVYNTTEAAQCGVNPRPCAFPAQGKH